MFEFAKVKSEIEEERCEKKKKIIKGKISSPLDPSKREVRGRERSVKKRKRKYIITLGSSNILCLYLCSPVAGTHMVPLVSAFYNLVRTYSVQFLGSSGWEWGATPVLSLLLHCKSIPQWC